MSGGRSESAGSVAACSPAWGNLAGTAQLRHAASISRVSIACSNSPSCCDTASNTNRSKPSITVAAFTVVLHLGPP